MKCIIRFFVVFTIFSTCQAQDSVKIYLLSRDIGVLIDSTERVKYNLFPKLGNEVVSTFIIQYNYGFYIYVKLKKGEQTIDTLQECSFTSYINSSKRVQMIERKETSLDFEPKIEFIDTVVFLPPHSGIPQSSDLNTLKDDKETIKILEKAIKKREPLPLADSNIDLYSILKDQLIIYIGFGTGLRSGIKDLNKIYNTYEETLSFQQNIPLSSSDYAPGLLLNLSTTLIFRELFFLELKYGFTTGGPDNDKMKYRSFKASLGYRYKLSGTFFPYISTGFAGNTFYYDKSYNKTVNNTTLESILVEGSSQGLDLTGGIMFETGDVFILNLYAGYQFMSKVSPPDYPDWKIGTSSFTAGLAIMIR